MPRTTRYRRNVWYKVEGDVNGAAYGCTFARWTGDCVEVRKVQPVVEYVGESEAADVGHPYWTREGSYDDDDMRAILRDRNPRGWAPQDYVGLDYPPDARLTVALRFELACAALDYGQGAEEGPAGWADDVYPRNDDGAFARVKGESIRDFRAEDREFRRMLRER